MAPVCEQLDEEEVRVATTAPTMTNQSKDVRATVRSVEDESRLDVSRSAGDASRCGAEAAAGFGLFRRCIVKQCSCPKLRMKHDVD